VRAEKDPQVKTAPSHGQRRVMWITSRPDSGIIQSAGQTQTAPRPNVARLHRRMDHHLGICSSTLSPAPSAATGRGDGERWRARPAEAERRPGSPARITARRAQANVTRWRARTRAYAPSHAHSSSEPSAAPHCGKLVRPDSGMLLWRGVLTKKSLVRPPHQGKGRAAQRNKAGDSRAGRLAQAVSGLGDAVACINRRRAPPAQSSHHKL